MDRFSLLSDELLIKILSFVPTKVAVSTSVLSKRWEYLWMWLPKLRYCKGCYSSSECKRLQCFLERNLVLHRAPVIESLHLDLYTPHFTPESIKLWIVVAISHCLRELEVHSYFYPNELDMLPSNLYTCKSLVVLKLNGDILLDVPRMVFLPSLKTLHLNGMRYFSEETLPQLLSNCPILEDLLLVLHRELDYEVKGVTVIVPSLQSLSLNIPNPCEDVITIKTPSLKYLELIDHNLENHNWLIENMPNLIKAEINVNLVNIKGLIGSLTSVKHLAICSGGGYEYGLVFNQLRHLQISNEREHSPDLLVRLLNDSPNLQVLDILRMTFNGEDGNDGDDEFVYWKQPSTVPECMLSSLQTFNWDEYTGERGERDLVVYILNNASHLRTATIKYIESLVPKYEMLKDLALTSRPSTCQLMFNPVLRR